MTSHYCGVVLFVEGWEIGNTVMNSKIKSITRGLIMLALGAVGFLLMQCVESRKHSNASMPAEPSVELVEPSVITDVQVTSVVTMAEDPAKAARDAILAEKGFDTNRGHRVAVKYQSRTTK